jgi:rRNA processing protein Krr1/Pno1
MLELLIDTLFVIAACTAVLSLADSAIKARNAFRAVKRSMELEDALALHQLNCDVAAFDTCRDQHRSKAPVRLPVVNSPVALAA